MQHDTTRHAVKQFCLQGTCLVAGDPGSQCCRCAHNDPELPATAAIWNKEDNYQHIIRVRLTGEKISGGSSLLSDIT